MMSPNILILLRINILDLSHSILLNIMLNLMEVTPQMKFLILNVCMMDIIILLLSDLFILSLK